MSMSPDEGEDHIRRTFSQRRWSGHFLLKAGQDLVLVESHMGTTHALLKYL